MSRWFSDMKRFLGFFTKKLRLSNPWNYKVPLLITVPYLLLLLSNESAEEPLLGIAASLFIIIGVAGIGYLSNDLGDRKKDQLIEKENITTKMSFAGILQLFVLFFSLALAPWLYLPANTWSVVLLLFQFVLFFSYALPPFRFKEHPFLGILTDALYAHANPALLAAYTFYLYTGRSFPYFAAFLCLLLFWQTILGIRNILLHQLKDCENDLLSGTRTFVTMFGKTPALNISKYVILPLELIAFIALCLFLFPTLPFLLPAMLLFWVFRIVRHKNNFKTMSYKELTYLFLDDFYILWLPLLVLAGLMLKSASFAAILLLHILIFRNEIRSTCHTFIRRFSQTVLMMARNLFRIKRNGR